MIKLLPKISFSANKDSVRIFTALIIWFSGRNESMQMIRLLFAEIVRLIFFITVSKTTLRQWIIMLFFRIIWTIWHWGFKSFIHLVRKHVLRRYSRISYLIKFIFLFFLPNLNAICRFDILIRLFEAKRLITSTLLKIIIISLLKYLFFLLRFYWMSIRIMWISIVILCNLAGFHNSFNGFWFIGVIFGPLQFTVNLVTFVFLSNLIFRIWMIGMFGVVIHLFGISLTETARIHTFVIMLSYLFVWSGGRIILFLNVIFLKVMHICIIICYIITIS